MWQRQQGYGERLVIAARQPLRAGRADLRARRGEGREAEGRPERAWARPKLEDVNYSGDTNLADPIVAPFVTKTTDQLNAMRHPGGSRQDHNHADHQRKPVGNTYGAAHGGVLQRPVSRPVDEAQSPSRPEVTGRLRLAQRGEPLWRHRRVVVVERPMSAQLQPAVEAIAVSKQFGSTRALRAVDVAIQSGRCLGLVGRNGAGKSTLVSILSGLLAPDSGEVRFEGGARLRR